MYIYFRVYYNTSFRNPKLGSASIDLTLQNIAKAMLLLMVRNIINMILQ
jgi:hypothetical protein